MLEFRRKTVAHLEFLHHQKHEMYRNIDESPHAEAHEEMMDKWLRQRLLAFLESEEIHSLEQYLSAGADGTEKVLDYWHEKGFVRRPGAHSHTPAAKGAGHDGVDAVVSLLQVLAAFTADGR